MTKITITIDTDNLTDWKKIHTTNLNTACNREILNDIEVNLITKELYCIKNVTDFLKSVADDDNNTRSLIRKVEWNRNDKIDVFKALTRYVEPIVNQPMPEMPIDRY